MNYSPASLSALLAISTILSPLATPVQAQYDNSVRGVAEREIARMILQYLTAHPDAKDTLEGIAQWWLRRGWSETPGGGLERAVASLCAQGLILETRRRGLPPLSPRHSRGCRPSASITA